MNKQELRRQIRHQKQAMTEQEIREKSELLARLLFASEEYRNARSIYGYLAFNQEVRTLPILEQALREGKQVAVPKCYGNEMRFIWLSDLTAVQASPMGNPEPVADGPVAEDEDALVLMPGLAFDKEGRRIGYGGGYYDKFLARERHHPTLALCYAFQVYDYLETEEFDIPADRILWV